MHAAARENRPAPRGATSNNGPALKGSLSEETSQELSQLCRQRAAFYGLLSRLFRLEVDQLLLTDLSASSFPAETGSADIDAGYLKMASYLSGDLESALLDLAVDYSRTFIGHGNNAYSAAYPFESVYISEKRLMMQEARDEVIAIYQDDGMRIEPGWNDPEDHLALELEYMQVLSSRAADALADSKEKKALSLIDRQREFHRHHLASWVPMMTADMRRVASTGFYQGLAHLTDGFLELDGEFLNDISRQ